MQSQRLVPTNFNSHLFSGDTPPDVSQVLTIERNGAARPFAARYVLNTKRTPIPVAPVVDWFVPIVHMAARPPYNLVFDGKHMRRGATGVGSFAIRDRRIEQYNENLTVDNVSFYIPMADLARLSREMKCARIETLPSLLDQDHYDPVMFHMARTMEAVLERPSEASTVFLDHMFDAVCSHIAVTYGNLRGRQTARAGGLSPRQEARVKDLLLADLRGSISLECLAQSCGMSERHFSRAFKQSTGLPPHQWLLVKRVERAQLLLRRTTCLISDIALDCGFANQSHLTRVFSRAVGASPAVWRRDHRT